MKKTMLLTFIFFLFLPLQALAVDYTITDVKIDADMHENGQVAVRELHTYSFDSEFNGITREIIPKEGTSIADFIAIENGQALKVELEDHLYKVFRKGANETIQIELQYTIENAVRKHADMAEFYWPFFDDRNESSYENMTITIYPPRETTEVIAIGYDAMFESQTAQSNGTVVFAPGRVSDGENGDVRVAYESALFPGTALASNDVIRPALLEEQSKLIEEAEQFLDRQEALSSIGVVGLSSAAAALAALMGGTFFIARRKKKAVAQEWASKTGFVPVSSLSVPATIYFTNAHQLPPDAVAAGLLDLVRQGYVEQLADDHFIVISRNVKHEHERQLLDWLFDEIGSDGEFKTEDLDRYVKNEKNHSRYLSELAKWRQTVGEEVKQAGLYENRRVLRQVIGLLSVLLLPAALMFGIYELYVCMFAAICIAVAALIFAIFYKPKTWEGHEVSQQWKKQILKMDVNSWPLKEKTHAFLYAVGKKDTALRDRFSNSDEAIQPYMYTVPGIVYVFQTSDTEVSAASSSSSSSSSGGGTGGGGGGSGAF